MLLKQNKKWRIWFSLPFCLWFTLMMWWSQRHILSRKHGGGEGSAGYPKKAAFQSGDKEELNTARARLKAGIKGAKMSEGTQERLQLKQQRFGRQVKISQAAKARLLPSGVSLLPDDQNNLMKCFEKLVLQHIKYNIQTHLDFHHFPYRANRSTEVVINTALHSVTHIKIVNYNSECCLWISYQISIQSLTWGWLEY